MSSDDQWKDGVPPLPSGVEPAVPAPAAPPAAPPYGSAVVPPPVDGAYPPPPPVGYAPPPTLGGRTGEKNWMGITSLVFGVIGGIVLALIFGLLSLSAYRQGKANNRGFAIAGMSAAGAWVLLFALGIGALAIFGDGEDTIYVQNATVGDCFSSNLDRSEDFSEGIYTFSPCSSETNGIVYYVTAAEAGLNYGDADMAAALEAICTSDVAGADVDLDIAYDYWVEYYVPSQDLWDDGNRTVVCGLSTEGEIDYNVLITGEPNFAD